MASVYPFRLSFNPGGSHSRLVAWELQHEEDVLAIREGSSIPALTSLQVSLQHVARSFQAPPYNKLDGTSSVTWLRVSV
eukprot:4336694-Amphidinium_carterae.1